MSRIFDALQRSQGDNPNASPLKTPVSPVAPEGIPVSAGAIPEVAPLSATATVATTESAASWLNVPSERVLHPHPTAENRVVTLSNPNSPGAEVFRVLSTRLAHMKDKRRINKLLVTSAVGEEGKSVVAVNLAVALAQRPAERVLLLEADLRRPTASQLLGSSSLSGITEWQDGKLAIENGLYQVEGMPLWFLSAGEGMEEPLPLLESVEFASMLQNLALNFDWVVIDSTPMLPMADATSLSRLADGVLVVVREGHTRRKVLNKALDSIERNKLLGVVFNEVSAQQVSYDRYYGQYGYYGYGKENGSKSDAGKGKAASA